MLASEASSLLSSGRLGFFPIPFEVSPKGELSRATTEAMKYTTAIATKSVHSQTAGRVLQSDTCILQQPPYSSPPALNISAASLPIFQSPGYCSFYQLQTPVIDTQWNLYSSGNYAITSRFLSFFPWTF